MIFFNQKNKSIKLVSGILAIVYCLIPFFIETRSNIDDTNYFPSKAIYDLFKLLYTNTIIPFLIELLFISIIWGLTYQVILLLKSILIKFKLNSKEKL
jgi:hypothetical protein